MGVWGGGGSGLWRGGGVLPDATAKDGANFGMALATLTHATVLPAMGLSAEQRSRVCGSDSEMVSHVVYGMMTETVRRFVRKRLD